LNAPDVVLQASIDQTIRMDNGGNVVLSVTERYESSRETNLAYLVESRAGSYTRTDASISYNSPGRRWTLTAYVQNLENKAITGLVNPGRNYTITGGGLLDTSLFPPRTFGVRGSFAF
jgi:iron complex outermembrane receptor protein